MNPLGLDDVPILDEDTGRFLSSKHMRIAEIIQDYNPTLHLAWIPPDQRGELDREFPFCVLHFAENGKQYVVHKYRENEVDERILADLFSRDMSKTDVLGRLEAEEKAREAYALKRRMEEAEERQDFIASVVKSPLHTYRHNGRRFD